MYSNVTQVQCTMCVRVSVQGEKGKEKENGLIGHPLS